MNGNVILMSGFPLTQNEVKNYKVYKHTSPSGKVYIGITQQDVKKRWNYGNGYSRNLHFFNAIKKYGWKNFEHEILFDNLTHKEACEKEKELIVFYKSNNSNFGYNLDNGGLCREKHSSQTKNKIRKSLQGHNVTLSTKEKMTHIYLEAFGERHSISEWAKITHIKPQTIYARIYEYNKTIEEALTTEEFRGKAIQKPVIMLKTNGEFVKEYESVTQAQRETGIQHIGGCCNGKRQTAGGFVWRWSAQQE